MAQGASESMAAELARIDVEFFKGKGKDVIVNGSSSKGRATLAVPSKGKGKGKVGADVR
jgi:hypothetical protein